MDFQLDNDRKSICRYKAAATWTIDVQIRSCFAAKALLYAAILVAKIRNIYISDVLNSFRRIFPPNFWILNFESTCPFFVVYIAAYSSAFAAKHDRIWNSITIVYKLHVLDAASSTNVIVVPLMIRVNVSTPSLSTACSYIKSLPFLLSAFGWSLFIGGYDGE